MKNGAYRDTEIVKCLQKDVADLISKGMRLALINQPIIGCVVRKDLSEKIANAYKELSNEVGDYYYNLLTSGNAVPVIPINIDRYYQPGELFFTS